MSTSTHLNCPRCGLSIEVRPHRTAIRHCPRCVGRSRLIVELFSSTLPADVLYDESSLPRVDDELAMASTSTSGKRRQQAQVPIHEPCSQLGVFDIPRRHQGMEVAYAFLGVCNRRVSGAFSARGRPWRVVESSLASPQPSAGIASPAPTFGWQRAITNGRRVNVAEKEPYHASQSL
jgi:hypothetical protein